MHKLYDAAKRGDLTLVRELLDKGADVNAPDEYGRTPLSVATLLGHIEVAAILKARGGQR